MAIALVGIMGGPWVFLPWCMPLSASGVLLSIVLSLSLMTLFFSSSQPRQLLHSILSWLVYGMQFFWAISQDLAVVNIVRVVPDMVNCLVRFLLLCQRWIRFLGGLLH
jgi:hypothetical protein